MAVVAAGPAAAAVGLLPGGSACPWTSTTAMEVIFLTSYRKTRIRGNNKTSLDLSVKINDKSLKHNISETKQYDFRVQGKQTHMYTLQSFIDMKQYKCGKIKL